MTRPVLILFLFCLQFACATAAKPDYEAKTFSFHDFSMPYREAVFTADSDSAAMLVILLHSRHSRGNANNAHLSADGVRETANFLADSGHNARFIIPQCPDNREWNERHPVAGFFMTDALKALIDSCIATGTVDPSRIFILGASMGGSGVWRMVDENPTLFAGAFIAAANPRVTDVANLLHTSLYIAVGERDRMAKRSRTEKLVKNINSRGGNATLEILLGAGHGDACRFAYSLSALQAILPHR